MDRRQRWVLDVDEPAIDDRARRPSLARRTESTLRLARLRSKREAVQRWHHRPSIVCARSTYSSASSWSHNVQRQAGPLGGSEGIAFAQRGCSGQRPGHARFSSPYVITARFVSGFREAPKAGGVASSALMAAYAVSPGRRLM